MTKSNGFNWISQFILNFTVYTKFHNFDQISHFQLNFTISTEFHNFNWILQFQLNFTMMSGFHIFNLISQLDTHTTSCFSKFLVKTKRLRFKSVLQLTWNSRLPATHPKVVILFSFFNANAFFSIFFSSFSFLPQSLSFFSLTPIFYPLFTKNFLTILNHF